MKRHLLPALLLPLLAAPAVGAPISEDICTFLLHEAMFDREDQALEVQLALTRRGAAEDIFKMLDGLWRNDALPRMVHLRGKYDQDIARLEVTRQQILLRRQEAIVEFFRSLCSSPESGAGDGLPDGYLQADCDARGIAAEIAAVELAFRETLLESYRDLRREDVASASDVILQERDVELARASREDLAGRHARCRAALSPAPPP
ncbi:MAG: hypothetical protein PVF68_16660 [Acidobacteriota bacterium]|jgi:hypothetical protein